MLYSELGFWFAQQPVEVQIITIYLLGITTMVLFVLDCWYRDNNNQSKKKKN